ncbi:hypothetical protein GCK32_005287 [Trichostrongylus colubriformis]|uniref:Uncharacterized protein n=1 Tax=Trichostrongylus colubriformis TaxID=6319 RepID=A0AAN8J325_TRICO
MNYGLLHNGPPITIICVLGLVSSVVPGTISPRMRIGMGKSSGSIQCTPDGLQITISGVKSFELCLEGYCLLRDDPPETEQICLPPEITLHEHTVHWKVSNGAKMKSLAPPLPTVHLLVLHS